MALSLGTIFSDIRIRLDALRADEGEANGIFTGLRERIQQTATSLQETMTQGAQGAATAMKEGMAEATSAVQQGSAEQAAAAKDAAAQTKTAAEESSTALQKTAAAGKEAGAGLQATGEGARIAKTGLFGLLGTVADLIKGFIAIEAVSKVFEFVSGAVHGFMEQTSDAANQDAQLNAVLASTHEKAGITKEAVLALADSLSKVTKYDDDVIISGQSMLLTFTNIGRDVFPRATEAVLNLAEKFGSVQAASVQVGKALNDPITGVTALRRVGVSLSAEQEKLIKHFMATGQVAKAQKIILDELDTEFGNLARTTGDTVPGKIARMQHAWNDAQKAIGKFIQEGIGKLIDRVGPLVIALGQHIPAALERVRRFLGDARDKFHEVISFFQKNKPALDALQGALLGLGAVLLILAIGALPPLIASVWALTTAFVGLIASALVTAAPFILVAAAIAALWFAFKQAYENIKPFHEWVDKLRDNLGKLGNQGLSLVQKGLAQIIPLIQTAAHWVGGRLAEAWKVLQPFVVRVAAALQRFWTEVAPKLLPALRTIGIIVGVLVAVLLAVPIAIGFMVYQIITHWSQIQKFLAPALLALRTLWNAVWPGLQRVLQGVWDVIVGIVKIAWSIVSGIIKIGLDLLGGNWSGAWNDLLDMLRGIWDGIQQVIRGALGIIVGVVQAQLGFLGEIFRTAWNGLLSFLSGLGTAMFNAGKNLIQMIIDGIKSMLGAVGNVASSVAQSIKNNLGFHSPTPQGPGRDADTWMPNLMTMLAAGIDGDDGLRSAAARAAGTLRGAFAGGIGLHVATGAGLAAGGAGALLGAVGGNAYHTHQTDIHLDVQVVHEAGDPTNPYDSGQVFGMSMGAALQGALAQRGYTG